jgi:pimeloyl-ACP methyl ester carboxylesterase
MTYVFVHGGNVSSDTWNKLVKNSSYPAGKRLGGKVWQPIISVLEQHGHQSFAPTLLHENTHNLSDHIEQICTLIEKHNLKDIVLVGHSYGGMVITGVADKMAESIKCLVYLDAVLPEPDQSLFDVLVLSGYKTDAVIEGAPKAYVEKIQFDPASLQHIEKAYIHCTKSQFLSLTNFAKVKIEKEQSEKWHYIELPTSHLPMATMPEGLFEVLLGFA